MYIIDLTDIRTYFCNEIFVVWPERCEAQTKGLHKIISAFPF